MTQEASRNVYDAVVIGGGIGGLTAGAFLAKAGKQVLVVERADRPGGYAREFQHGPYKINPALHLIMGCGDSSQSAHGLIETALSHLGVQGQCQFTTVDPFYRALFPDFQIDVPPVRDAFLQAHGQIFPEEAKALAELMDLCHQIYQEFVRFPIVPRLRDWALMPVRFPKIFRYANASLASVLDDFFSNSRMKSVYSTMWSYVGLPPSRVSFPMWSVMISSYIDEGPFYCLGGFQNLADAIADGMQKQGGELLTGVEVIQILATSSNVKGIKLGNGQVIEAPVVISNIDARKTYQELLQPGLISASIIKKLKRLEPSIYLFNLHLATDLDIQQLGIPKVTMITDWDLDQTYIDALDRKVSGLAVHVPSIVDATLAPPGEHIVILQGLDPNGAKKLSDSDRAQFAEALLVHAEKILPGLREHITFIDKNDGEIQRYPLHRLGPIYGWTALPQQSGARRLPNHTPLKGLYLAGHWTQPGHGIWSVVLSGINTARLVLGHDPSESLWPFGL
jgi:prolycopene isomerase